MHTQLNCPNCGTPYTAEVHQVVDSKHTPELKEHLLNGSLNMAVCPNCGAGGPLSTVLLFHDPDYELFMVFVPQELNLNHTQREQTIGRLAQNVMDNLPPEERRAYMLQPQIMLNMKTFMEKVLETEGITKEMIDRQQKQAELLQTLAQTDDKDVQDYLIKERVSEIDETFFAMLQSFIDTAAQMDDNAQILPLINLRAKLMTETAVGRQMEQQQIAVHKMNQIAKKQGGLTPELLAQHVVANQEDEVIVEGLVMSGQGALRYEFFSELTAAIEAAKKEGDQTAVQRLSGYRDKYLALFDQMQNASQQMLAATMQTLDQILQADDVRAAVLENAQNLDDTFMYVLTARLQDAQEKGRQEEAQKLDEIQAFIMEMVEQQMPPEMQFINSLMRAETPEQQTEMLDANPTLISPDLVAMIDQALEQVEQTGQKELNGRLQAIKAAIQERL
ncbi:MAG: hypothetical protein GY796_12285 [Chloroflexi bacterium]|nr:hypothetical protein [Chloroflexota bacterium]